MSSAPLTVRLRLFSKVLHLTDGLSCSGGVNDDMFESGRVGQQIEGWPALPPHHLRARSFSDGEQRQSLAPDVSANINTCTDVSAAVRTGPPARS